MAIKATVVTVTTTATPLNDAQSDWVPGSNYLVLIPSAGQMVYVGGADVTVANGYPYTPGTEHEVGTDSLTPGAQGEILYGIVSATTQTVNVLAQGI